MPTAIPSLLHTSYKSFIIDYGSNICTKVVCLPKMMIFHSKKSFYVKKWHLNHAHWELRICIENEKIKNRKTWGSAFIEYSEDHVFENAKMFPIFAILNSQWPKYFFYHLLGTWFLMNIILKDSFYCPLDLNFFFWVSFNIPWYDTYSGYCFWCHFLAKTRQIQ